MGSKRRAKVAMIAAGVPCIAGYEGTDQGDDTLRLEAEHIGYPLMIKASAGGGGRGMRLVWRAEDLLEQLRTARSEALHGFGNDELILEQALIRSEEHTYALQSIMRISYAVFYLKTKKPKTQTTNY